MAIVAIDHVQLAMPPGREAEARRFYVDLLGFSELPKPTDLASRGGVWLHRGDVQLHLGVEPGFQPARKAHPAFLVEGLVDLLERLRGAGCEIDSAQPPLPGFQRAHVFDPFGNRIELLERLTGGRSS